MRNKSNTEDLICAASSSSCMADLRTFNNNKLFSCHTVVGIVRPPTEDKIDDFLFCLLQNVVIENVTMGVKVVIQRTNDTPTDIATLIKNAVVNNFNGLTSYERAKMGDKIFASRFYTDVISAGASNLTSVEIAYPASGTYGDVVNIPLDEMPVMSVENVLVYITE